VDALSLKWTLNAWLQGMFTLLAVQGQVQDNNLSRVQPLGQPDQAVNAGLHASRCAASFPHEEEWDGELTTRSASWVGPSASAQHHYPHSSAITHELGALASLATLQSVRRLREYTEVRAHHWIGLLLHGAVGQPLCSQVPS
jgi:hypothetical protein